MIREASNIVADNLTRQYNNNVIEQLYSRNKKIIIFDIGANNFRDSIDYKRRFPEASVVSFEPDRDLYRAYSQQAVDCGIVTVEAAVSDQDGETTFYPSLGHRASGSTLKPVVVEGTNRLAGYTFDMDLEGYSVPTTRFDTYCNQHNISKVDFVHMDVQGGEYKVMSSVGNYRPTYVFAETVEFNTYHTGVTTDDFDNLMFDLGYKIHTAFIYDTLYELN